MTRDQRNVVMTCLKRLAKLQNNVKNPDVLEHLNVAALELFEVAKMRRKQGVRYKRNTTFKAARMYQGGVPLKQISFETGMHIETVRRIVIDLNLPRRYKIRPKKELVE